MWIKGSYGSRHPKDVAARKAQELQKRIQSNSLSKKEMWDPSERNVRRHIEEQKITVRDALELKKIVKGLDKEDHKWGNTETFRRKR